MPNAQECAQLLLETVPSLMRSFGETMRQCQRGDDEAINMGQLRKLGILPAGARTLGELANLHHVTPSTMSRTVDVLVRKTLVERRSAPTARRQVFLSLTPAGTEAHATFSREMHEAMSQTVAGLIGELSDDERARLYDGLSVLRALLKRPTSAGC